MVSFRLFMVFLGGLLLLVHFGEAWLPKGKAITANLSLRRPRLPPHTNHFCTGAHWYRPAVPGIFQPLHRQSTQLRLLEGIAGEDGITLTQALTGGSVLGGSYLLLQLAVYWRMQFVSAGIVSGIPPNSNIVEMDAADGKNVFYLPRNAFYTAVMPLNAADDAKKQEEKQRVNEQLILESIGKTNRGGTNIQGKVRTKTQQIPSKSVDCVLSIGAVGRATASQDAKVEVINEAYRMLRPGGLFVFVEPDNGNNFLDLMYKVFPKTIKGVSAGDKARRQNTQRAQASATTVDTEDASIGNSVPKMGSSSTDTTSKTGKSKKKKSGKGRGSKKQTKNLKLDSEVADTSVNMNDGNDSNDSNDSAIATGKSDMQGDYEDLDVSVTAPSSTDAADATTTTTTTVNAAVVQERPSISYQKLSNVFFPYITGIAVRP